MLAVALALPRPDHDDDFDDDDDDFFRFRQNGLRNINSFQPSFGFNSFGQSQPQRFQPTFQRPFFQQRTFQTPVFTPQHLQQSPSFNSFGPPLRECWPPPLSLEAGSELRHHDPGPNAHPILTIVRFAPFTLIRQSETTPPKLFLYVSASISPLAL